MKPAAAVILAFFLGSHFSPDSLALRISQGARDFLRLAPEAEVAVRVDASASSPLTGRLGAVSITIPGLDLAAVTLPPPGVPGPRGNLRGSIGTVIIHLPDASIGPFHFRQISMTTYDLQFNL